MRNICNFCIIFLLFAAVCYAQEIETNSEDNELQLRFGRRSQQAESSGENIKKQKHQQKQKEEDSVATIRSQLTPSTANDLNTLQNNVDPNRNVVQNMQLQVRYLDPFNGGAPASYAFNYPYQGYPPQQIPSMANHGILFGNPNQLLAQQQSQSLPDFMYGQQMPTNSYAPNFMGNFGSNANAPQQGQLNVPQNLNPAYGTNFGGYGGLPLGQTGLENNIGIHGEPILPPSGYPNLFGLPGQLPGMPLTSLPGTPNGMLPHVPTNVDQQLQFNHPALPQQPQLINPLLGNAPFGMPPHNGVNYGFGAGFPEFMRNQRSLEQNADDE